MISATKRQQLLDGLAVGASTACLIHCLVLPVLFILLPALAAVIVIPESFHVAALAVAVPMSGLALTLGYRRHGNVNPAIFALPGLAALAVGALAVEAEWLETLLTVLGACLISIAHGVNWLAGSRVRRAR